MKRFLALVLGLICSVACTSTQLRTDGGLPGIPDLPPANMSAAYYFVDVTCPEEDPMPFVGGLCDASGVLGTGVLIDPQVVLTVAHVAACEPTRFETNGCSYPIAKMYTHPQYNGKPQQGVDLAVVILETPVLGVDIPVLTERPKVQRPDYVCVVGFSYQLKKISKIGTYHYFGNCAERSQFYSIWSASGNFWHGDSGGPVFVFQDDKVTIIGLVSIIEACDNIIMDNLAQRTDQHIDWIWDKVGEAFDISAAQRRRGIEEAAKCVVPAPVVPTPQLQAE